MKNIFAVLLCFLFSLSLAKAEEDTKKYEDYLNSLKTLEGTFTQTNSKGHKSHGKVYISRPGKMRLTYHPPSSLLIVADGKWLVTYDRENEDINYVSLDNTPAALILRPHVCFTGDVAITSVVRREDTTEISLVRRAEADMGTLSLVFTHSPITLKEWSVIDNQGIETRVKLSALKANKPVSPLLFKIESPNLMQQIF